MILTHNDSGKAVQKGDLVERAGDILEIMGWVQPFRPTASGRIYIRNSEGVNMEAVPSDYNMRFIAQII